MGGVLIGPVRPIWTGSVVCATSPSDFLIADPEIYHGLSTVTCPGPLTGIYLGTYLVIWSATEIGSLNGI